MVEHKAHEILSVGGWWKHF